MGQSRQGGRPLRKPISTNFFVCALTYIMNLCAPIPRPHEKDNRLYVDVNLYSLKGIKALVDTGANISVIAETVLNKIPFRHKLEQVPVNPGLRITSASGGEIQIVGRFMLKMEFPLQDGRVVTRPFYVVSGLYNHAIILGVDFIREQQLMISADHVFFQNLPEESQVSLLTLSPAADMVIPARTMMRVSVSPKTHTGRRLAEGTQVAAYTGKSNIGLWDSLGRVDAAGHIACVVSNKTNQPLFVEEHEVIGFADLIQESEIHVIDDAVIMEMFGSFGREPEEPAEEAKTAMSEEERAFLMANVKIEATSEWVQKYMDLILRYHDTCSKGSFDLGHTDKVKHKIKLKESDPIHIKQFRIPLEHVDVIHNWVDELIAKGAIQPSRSPYNSPIFLVKKAHGQGLRVVLDFRALNAASVPDKYSIREIRDCIDEIGQANSKIFSAIDLTSGFWQQELEESSRQYTAFTVPGKGTRYEWTVTPMGLQGSPSSFARLIDYIMTGLRGVICYIDDVLVHSSDHEKHLMQLEKVLKRLRKYGLKLNVKKTVFGADSITYLGYKLSGEGVSPGPDKLKAVREFPKPNSVKKIREFIGLCNYFRFLIPDFHKNAAQLTKLLKKDSAYGEGPLPREAQDAFQYLKSRLSAEPVVAHPQKGRPYHLRTDACAGDSLHPGGYGAVLSQVQEDGKERVIAYASRALKTYEENYQPYLLELAAAAWAIDYFHVYLKGRPFKLYTDHKPLEAMSKLHQKTMNRLQQQLLEYDFTVNYIKGSDNSAADALSRNVAAIESKRMLPVDMGDESQVTGLIASLEDASGSLAKAQRVDPFLRDIYCALKGESFPASSEAYVNKVQRWANDSFLKNGVIFYRLHRKNRPVQITILAPSALREKILSEAHTSWDGGHGGEQRTLDRIALNFTWPGISVDVDNFIKRCLRCQEAKGKKAAPAPLKNLPLCEEPNERIHVDLFGPLKTRSAEGNKYILVMTDAFSKYAELAAIPDKRADTVARAIFERWICRFSVPRMIITDNGKEFANQIMTDLCKFMGVQQNKTSPYHPQSNSSAESYNRQIRKYLTAMLENDETLDWEQWLPMLMFSYNTHVHSATKQSPFFLTFLHDPRLPYFDLDKPRLLYGEDYVSHAHRQLQEAHRVARSALEEQAAKAKHYHDVKARSRKFKIGQRVMVYFPDPPAGVNPKFWKKWKGPFLIKNLIGNLNLELQSMEKPKARHLVIHIDRCVESKSDKDLVGGFDHPEPAPPKDEDLSWADQVEIEQDAPRAIKWDIPEENKTAPDADAAVQENEGEEGEIPAPRSASPGSSARITRSRAARENTAVPSLYPIRF